MNRAVLIIDDDVNAQIIMETLLRLRGLAVRVAADAAVALEILERDDIGVVVVDVSVPGMNGIEGVRRFLDRGCCGPISCMRVSTYCNFFSAGQPS